MQIFNNPAIEGRKCGECTVCCTIMKVPELNKPNYVPCSQLCPTGCAIYNDKPQACNDFQCLWLDGRFGREEDRPDKSGIMLVTHPIKMGRYEMTLTAWLVAGLNDRLRYLLRKIAAIRVIAIREPEKFSLLGRREETEEVERTIGSETKEEAF